MTVNVFGSSSAPSELKAFSEPDRDDFSMLDHVGKAAIFEVQGIEQVSTKYGQKPAVKTNVVVLGDQPQRYDNVLIFSQVPIDQLGPAAGQLTVAVIETYVSKVSGKDAPKLGEPNQAAIDAANAYIKENAK